MKANGQGLYYFGLFEISFWLQMIIIGITQKLFAYFTFIYPLSENYYYVESEPGFYLRGSNRPIYSYSFTTLNMFVYFLNFTLRFTLQLVIKYSITT